MQTLSDAARLAIIHKHGGMYLDSDIVVLNNDLLTGVPSQVRIKNTQHTVVGAWLCNNSLVLHNAACPLQQTSTCA
jgi:hypothetical protein